MVLERLDHHAREWNSPFPRCGFRLGFAKFVMLIHGNVRDGATSLKASGLQIEI
jgi:hypothetical protein